MPQTSAPAPVTVKTPLLNVALPAAPVAPMSPWLQPAGRLVGGVPTVTDTIAATSWCAA